MKTESSKYAFRIDEINQNSTHGKILSKVEPGSKVLELGCASGYMTKYLHEKLNCTVHVVEIDEECIKQAVEYADDAQCGNLDEDIWYGYYSREKYDYILFADVLEHLRDPLHTLTMAGKLLKENGRILISIPNICHNDILIRMFYDNFTYTSLGLLDRTHIHFFGGNNLPEFVESADLKLESIECLMMKTGTTEQRCDPEQIDKELLELLKKRQLGEVYQYILVCRNG